MLRAILTHNFEQIKVLLNNGHNINEKHDSEMTLLMHAILHSSPEIVKYLIQNNANIHDKNTFGFTPLLIACDKKRWDIAKYLLNNNANINDEDINGYTPLMVSAEKGTFNNEFCFCKYLIDNNANINHISKNNKTLVDCVTPNIINFLFDNNYYIKITDCNTLLYKCIKFKLINNAIKLIKTKDCDLNNSKRSVLHIACHMKMYNIVELLIKNNVDVNLVDELKVSPLHIVCRNNTFKIVELLLKSDADINMHNYRHKTPIYYSNNIEIKKLLISNGANIYNNLNKHMISYHNTSFKDNFDMTYQKIQMFKKYFQKFTENIPVKNFQIYNNKLFLLLWIHNICNNYDFKFVIRHFIIPYLFR